MQYRNITLIAFLEYSFNLFHVFLLSILTAAFNLNMSQPVGQVTPVVDIVLLSTVNTFCRGKTWFDRTVCHYVVK